MKNSTLFKLALKKGLKIAYCDIETSPELNYTYATRKTTIQHNQVIAPMQITSVGYMFEGDKSATVLSWDQSTDKHNAFDILRQDRDKNLLKEVVPILNEADILIGQNSIEFDQKKIQWRLNVHSLPRLDNLIPLDILKQSYRAFSPLSHKLDYRSKVYGLGGKIKQDMDDCIAVAMGDQKAQNIRLKYNGKDVLDTRRVFWKELDYYTLPDGLLKTLKFYVGNDCVTFCVRCASRHQAKFNVNRQKLKNGYKLTCKGCDYSWKIKE
jgi:hypothetical protein